MFILPRCSIKMNLVYWLSFCPGSLKCWSTNDAFCNFVFLVVNQSKIKLTFRFTRVLHMTKSAFCKVYYKFTFKTKVIEDAVSSFSDAVCRTVWMYNLLATHISEFRKTIGWEAGFFFGFCYLHYFYVLFLLNAKIGICWKM